MSARRYRSMLFRILVFLLHLAENSYRGSIEFSEPLAISPENQVHLLLTAPVLCWLVTGAALALAVRFRVLYPKLYSHVTRFSVSR